MKLKLRRTKFATDVISPPDCAIGVSLHTSLSELKVIWTTHLMDRTGPAVENFSNSIASVTSGARSPTYLTTTKKVNNFFHFKSNNLIYLQTGHGVVWPRGCLTGGRCCLHSHFQSEYNTTNNSTRVFTFFGYSFFNIVFAFFWCFSVFFSN